MVIKGGRNMKKINSILIASLALIAVISCNKTTAPDPVPERIPVTLKVTIDDNADSKVSFTPAGNILKTAWESEETITVLTLNDLGSIATIDNLTYSGPGGKTVEFTGSIGRNATSTVKVIYPALDSYITSTTEHYGTPLPDGQTDSYRAISSVDIGGETYILNGAHGFTQSASGDTYHLKNAIVYEGTGNIDLDAGEVTSIKVSPISSVIRLDLTFPSDLVGKKLTSGTLQFANQENSKDYCFMPDFQSIRFGEDLPIGTSNNMVLHFGTWNEDGQEGLTIEGTDFVAYFPFIPSAGTSFGPASGGERVACMFMVDGRPSVSVNYITSDITLKPGMVYRAIVSF